MARQYGLIGYPLGHSFSKQYFTEKFTREALSDCTFEAFPIENINQFPALLAAHKDLKGMAVTIPYKEQVLQYVHELSDEVRVIGATNSIKISGNQLIAYNTDIIGFKASFQQQVQPHHKAALVLGTGGASKAVQYVLGQLEMPFKIVTRNNDLNPGHLRYDQLTPHLLQQHRVIINCTPVGMFPIVLMCPDIPYEWLTPDHYLYDLVYKPELTLFLEQGAQKGAVIKNGYDMLLLQAEASWEIWNS